MDETAGIYARKSAYLDRYVQMGVASGRVVSVSFPEVPDEEADENDHALLDRIDAYLEGNADDFADVEVGITAPTDQRAVLETAPGQRLEAPPVGQVVPPAGAQEEPQVTLGAAVGVPALLEGVLDHALQRRDARAGRQEGDVPL